MRGMHTPSWHWGLCPKTPLKSNRMEQSLPPARNKNLPGQTTPCQGPESWQGFRAWQGQSAIHMHWVWSNIWQSKVCRIRFFWEHGISPAGGDLHCGSFRCGTGRWAAQSSPPPAWEKRLLKKEVLKKKNARLFSEEMGRRKSTQFLKEYKSVAPPSPLCQDRLGKGKWCLAGCTAGGVALEKNLLFLERLLPGQGEQTFKKDFCKQLAQDCCLSMASSHLAPAPQCSPVLTLHYLSTLHAGKSKAASIDYSNRAKNS